MLVGYARPLGEPDAAGDVQSQVEALQAHGCDKVFVEESDVSDEAPPKLHEALQAAKPGDVLVIQRFAALAVSIGAFISTMQIIRRAGIELVSISDHLDTTAPEGAAIFALVAVLAALVDENGKPKRKKPAKATTNTNARSGRPKALSDEEFQLAKRLMTKTNMTMAEIAERLSVAPATLYRYFPGGRNAVSDEA